MPNKTWVDTAGKYAPGIPVSRRLVKGGDLISGDQALSGPLATGVAAAAYRLKNGQSAILSIPPFGPEGLRQIIDYLHSCRTDAMAGYIRAPWFQPNRMKETPDLLVWARNLKQKRRLQAAAHLNPVFVGKLRDPDRIADALETEEKLLRTIVCQQSFASNSLCETLSRVSRPFATIVDATPWGVREYAAELVEKLDQYFPGVPRLVLTVVGDRDLSGRLQRLTPEIPVWATGRRDHVLYGERKNASWSGKIALIPDRKLNDRLTSIYRHIKVLEGEVKAPAHKEIHRALLRVWQTILNMVVPADFHEVCADEQRKGGLYPIRPIADELRIARRATMPSGASQSAVEQIFEEVEQLLEFLSTGTSGKTMAMMKWAKATLKEGKKGLIASGSVRDAAVIRQYLLSKFQKSIVDKRLQVVAARGVDGLYTMDSAVASVFIATSIRKSDYWITGLGKEFIWANYPIQQEFAEKWSHEIQGVSQGLDNGEKEAWWTYEQTDGEDRHETLEVETWTDCTGQYATKEEFHFEAEVDENWAATLLNDLEWKEPTEKEEGQGVSGDQIVVYTGEAVHHFEPNQGIDLLSEDGESTDRVRAKDLSPGNVIVFQTQGSDDGALLDTVMEAIYGTTGELQIKRDFAAKWRPMVSDAFKACGKDLTRLEKKMASAGVARQSLSNWLSGRNTISKNKEVIIPMMAKIAGDSYSDDLAKSICAFIGELHGKRGVAGKILHRARLAMARGDDFITINKEELPVDMLEEAIHFEEVLSVDIPDDKDDSGEELDWLQAIAAIADDSGGRLIVTAAAKKSLEDCHYKDRDRAVKCIALLLDTLHPVYFSDNPLQDAVEKLSNQGITYRGGMAETTQGLFKDVYKSKVYKGRKADLSKHVRIGNSYSKDRCFSVHFEVDKEDQALVIHHAGGHLKTSRD